ncbi:MAG: hypothetical protein U5Q44_09230 [Dehalococcoidia bacterium]|nr:hypothetical protein [Dehalococcoidia bacterium]
MAEAILLGRSTVRTIKQNLGWAFGYNTLAIPVAATGMLNPIVAGGAMALSSISVMANSLRLRTRSNAVARQAGNTPTQGRMALGGESRATMAAFGLAVVVVVAPLVIFTGVDRGWFGG